MYYILLLLNNFISTISFLILLLAPFFILNRREHWKTLCNLVQYDNMQGCDASDVKSTEPMPVEPAVA